MSKANAAGPRPELKGMIFDLDGTLVDSRLDFDRMRADIGIPLGRPILEYLETLTDEARLREAHEILHRHEMQGAREATLYAGVREFIDGLVALRIPHGILTRNTVEPTQLTLERHGLTSFSQVLTRESAPAKPDPAGLLMICREWGCEPHEALFVGDYRFDLEAGRRAGMKTLLYAPDEIPEFASDADHVFTCFQELHETFENVLTLALGFQSRAPGADQPK